LAQFSLAQAAHASCEHARAIALLRAIDTHNEAAD